MENRKKSVLGYAGLCARLVGSAALLLCLVQCSAEQSSGEAGEENLGSVSQAVITYPHCGGIACMSSSTCQTVANLPLGADPFSATCHATSHECVWKLKTTDPNFPCLEHDVRHCNINPTTGGVQICTANGARTATSWGACQATPVCNP